MRPRQRPPSNNYASHLLSAGDAFGTRLSHVLSDRRLCKSRSRHGGKLTHVLHVTVMRSVAHVRRQGIQWWEDADAERGPRRPAQEAVPTNSVAQSLGRTLMFDLILMIVERADLWQQYFRMALNDGKMVSEAQPSLVSCLGLSGQTSPGVSFLWVSHCLRRVPLSNLWP